MKKDVLRGFLILFLSITFCLLTAGISFSQDAVDIVQEGDGRIQPGDPPPLADPIPLAAIIYDNGPIVTHPGGGAGGADASALQTALSMNTYGWGHQFSLGYRVADDFTISDPNGWTIDEIIFFAYQTGSPTSPSPITGVYFQIWNGPPDNPGSSVVFGDLTTNRLTNTTWSNIYRVLDTSLGDTSRPVMANTASAGVWLPQGTYWLEWMTDGSLGSGPWAPPISILGQTTTGNALQFFNGAWAPVLDSGTGTQQGFPFILISNVDLVTTFLDAEIINMFNTRIRTIDVSYRVENQGSAASDPSTLLFFLSDDPVLSMDDLFLGFADIPGLAPGEETLLAILRFRVAVPPHDWYVIALTGTGNETSVLLHR